MTETERLVREHLDYLEIEKNRSAMTRENCGRFLTTIQVYTHLTNKELREVHEMFHAR
ncbi:MAG: hypothetical protein Q7S84_04155 [bacterium]|nr:hypothetical protein [bacterium]